MINLSEISEQFVNWGAELTYSWGYAGAFLVSLIGNASIIFPIPSYLAVFALGPALNPWILGLVAAAGATLGELTGYLLGLGGGKVLSKKHTKAVNIAEQWRKKRGMFLVIVLFAATTLPDDVVGILGGAMKYDLKKFLSAAFIGKTISHTLLAWGGFFGASALGGYSGLFSILLIVVTVVVLAYTVLKEGEDNEKRS
jgi:membrane protein YqaA with SNARE-associated domain